MFFHSFMELGRILLVGSLAYLSLIVMLRVTGNRTLSKMNAFDFIVTIALGSVLATVLLDNSVSLSEGAVAFFVLIGMQFIVTWLSVRFPIVDRLVKSVPVLLVYEGRILSRAMKAARVTEDEVLTAVRNQGIPALDNVQAVVLETDGTFAVVGRTKEPTTTLRNVDRSGIDIGHDSWQLKRK
ncbi:MAG TPA: YetF domain-containing protein [Thermomicrobiales bacterium]|nr:YetF domain-containing protein [Thermomicrobiales bacterium]